MQAVILAGGEGTRLRPLTFTLPKPLIPLVNRPLAEYSLRLLKRHGIEDVILAISYLPEAVREQFGDGRSLGMRIDYCVEETPLGTGGALRNAAGLLDGTFLAMNGDLIMDADLAELIGFHRRQDAIATIGVRQVEDPSDFGLVLTDEDFRVQDFLEKRPTDPTGRNLINAGIYIMEPAVLDRVPAGEQWSLERQLFPDLIEAGEPVFASPVGGYWIDLSTPDRLLQATWDLMDGKSTVHTLDARLSADLAAVRAPVSLGDDCDIAGGAAVGPYVALGDGVRVGPDAVIQNSVLLDGTHVGRAARLIGCLVGRDCEIGGQVHIGEGTVLGDRCVVA